MYDYGVWGLGLLITTGGLPKWRMCTLKLRNLSTVHPSRSTAEKQWIGACA